MINKLIKVKLVQEKSHRFYYKFYYQRKAGVKTYLVYI